MMEADVYLSPRLMQGFNDNMARLLTEKLDRDSRRLLGIPSSSALRAASSPKSDPWADILETIDSLYEARDAKFEAMEACAMDLFACLSEPGCRADDAVIYTWEHPVYRHGFAFAAYKGERVGPGRTWGGISGSSLTK